MILDLNKLEELARETSYGTWVCKEESSLIATVVATGRGVDYNVASDVDIEDAQFIAAASPAVVLEMISLIRRQEAELVAAREACAGQVEINNAYLREIDELKAAASPAAPAADDLLEVVRTICAIAARMRELPDDKRQHYPAPTAEGSPLLAAARAACVARGYTTDGLAVPGVEYPASAPVAEAAPTDLQKLLTEAAQALELSAICDEAYDVDPLAVEYARELAKRLRAAAPAPGEASQ